MLLAVAVLKIRDGDFFCKLLLCCVEKDAPELGDTPRRVFPALFWGMCYGASTARRGCKGAVSGEEGLPRGSGEPPPQLGRELSWPGLL